MRHPATSLFPTPSAKAGHDIAALFKALTDEVIETSTAARHEAADGDTALVLLLLRLASLSPLRAALGRHALRQAELVGFQGGDAAALSLAGVALRLWIDRNLLRPLGWPGADLRIARAAEAITEAADYGFVIDLMNDLDRWAFTN
ncbi:hypothetical protein [Mitsuaria sp. GD03876]|uniref:hypothetical protein n=1 Tax=Mitsuaria sp. GD03876 TaxID=2975399 RepID=UPI0024496EB9|nr:hypothetical protein [Mitsuaria sp. GD03876]MDH0865832.1 hypothetical protein [Mitsuaria sp. GD03876]